MSSLNVSEIFYSIQGEGLYVGYPAVFVRLSGCVKPYCPFCDTKYAWKNGRKMTGEEVLFEITRIPQAEYVVFTGGEPLLQYAELRPVVQSLERSSRYMIGWETSLKCYNWAFDHERKLDRISISPKFLNSAWRVSTEWKNLDRFMYLCVKFLIQNSIDVKRSLNFAQRYHISKSKVWFMPYGASREELISNSKIVWDLALQYGVKFSPRLQVYVYGMKKGV